MSNHSSHHVVSVKVYIAIFLALMVGTVLTVQAAFIDLGIFNNIVAMGIAVTKAMLVILFFMHVKYSSKLTQIIVASGFICFAILIVFAMSDYFTRGLLGVPGK